MFKLPISKETLWQRCILTSISHAISTANNPDFSYEHSWDGLNYNLQDSHGTRGTITFYHQLVVAAFRNERSERLYETKNAMAYFADAKEEAKLIAKNETLQYLLEENDGCIKPLITTVFWGEKDVYSCDDYEAFTSQSGDMLTIQFMEFDKAVEALIEVHDFSTKQTQLLLSLYERKIDNPEVEIVMTRSEISMLESEDEEGLEESEVLFNELGIVWDKK